jgi:hypothetical protein
MGSVLCHYYQDEKDIVMAATTVTVVPDDNDNDDKDNEVEDEQQWETSIASAISRLKERKSSQSIRLLFFNICVCV